MAKLRGLFLALALSALAGLAAREGRAESITITISTNGTTITETNSAWATATDINLGFLNTALSSAGSAYQFLSLGGSSNFPGTPIPNPNGGALSSSGAIFVPPSATGATGALVITTTEGGFLNPVGPDGTMTNTATSNYTNVATGTMSYFNSFNTTPSSTGSSASTGVINNSPPITIANTSVGAVASGYTLTNTATVNLTTNPTSMASLAFSGSAQVTAAIVIPEPASLILMLTGMPLPLVVLFLLRRRAAVA